MKKFDLVGYTLSQLLREASEDEDPLSNQQNPPQNQGNDPANTVPDQNQQTPTPASQTQQMKAASTPFNDFKENTIQDIQFKPTSAEGGSVIIKTHQHQRPIIISWENNRVTLQKPNGDIITLT